MNKGFGMKVIATNYQYYFVRKIVMPKRMVVELWQGGRLGGESFYQLQQFVALPDNFDAGCDS